MKTSKIVVELNRNEYSLLIGALNNFRNKQIVRDRCTDAVDELLIKVIGSPCSKVIN